MRKWTDPSRPERENVMQPSDRHCLLADYRRYLATPHWSRMRNLTIERAHNECALSTGPEHGGARHVHHRNYDRLGREWPEDLCVLCWKCHRKFHDTIEDGLLLEQQILLPLAFIAERDSTD
jgi:hypothetical protein